MNEVQQNGHKSRSKVNNLAHGSHREYAEMISSTRKREGRRGNRACKDEDEIKNRGFNARYSQHESLSSDSDSPTAERIHPTTIGASMAVVVVAVGVGVRTHGCLYF
jgi:hypothetical protein